MLRAARDGISLIALVMSATQLHAQSATPSPNPQPNAADPDAQTNDGVSDVVVTAQRREERLQNVPVAVTAITGDTLSSRGVNDISQLGKFVPGFSIGATGPNARPALRGARTANNGANADGPIAIFIDGIYQSRTAQALLGFFDVARVEVQRGPQGTLYGRNTFGGNVAIVTNQPGRDLDYAVTATVGNYDRHRVEGYINVPLTDTLAARIAGAFENQDGFTRNDFNKKADLNDERQRFVRGSLKYDNGDFTAVLRGEYFHNGGNGGSAFGYKQIGSYLDPRTCQFFYNSNIVRLNSRVGNLDGVADCTVSQQASGGPAVGTSVDRGIPIYKYDDARRIDTDFQTHRDQQNVLTSLDMQYDFGGLALRSISGYEDFDLSQTSDSDFSASTIAIDLLGVTAKTISQELQLLSVGAHKLDFVTGVYLFHDEVENLFINQQFPITVRSTATAAQPTAAANGGAYSYQRNITQSYAAYGQATYHLTDKFSAIVGVRYTNERKTFRDASGNGYLPLPSAAVPNPAVLINFGLPQTPADSYFGPRPANCGNGGTAAAVVDAAARYVSANYCPLQFEKVTYKGGLNFQATPENLLYGSVSTGFLSGGFNTGQLAAQNQPTFQPQTVTAYEIGSKNRFFGDKLQLNVSAFLNEYRGLQEARQLILGSTTLQTTLNAARGQAYGAEFEALVRPVRQLNLGATLSLLHARYRDFGNIPLPYGTSQLLVDPAATTATVVNGVTVAAAGFRRVFAPGYNCGPQAGTGGAGQPALTFVCDLSGNRIPHSPSHSGTVYAGYDIDLGGSGTLTPFAALTFSGAYFENQFNDQLARQAAWQKLDLNLTWKANDQVSVELYGTNITNRTIKTIVSVGGNPLQANYEPPRMYGLRLTLRR